MKFLDEKNNPYRHDIYNAGGLTLIGYIYLKTTKLF